jgi:hypothetical protein
MIKKMCHACGSVMIKKSTSEGEKRFCEKCDAFTGYDEAEMDPYCPVCGEKVTVCSSCCSQSFFCDKCNSVVSSKKLIWKK